jgi:DNA-binding NtrC family response regulator
MPPHRVLILDDEESLVRALCRHLEHHGYETAPAYRLSQAEAEVETSLRERRPFAAILTDLRLPDGDGRSIVRLAREKLPGCPVLVMTGSGSVSGSVEAMRLGAVTVLEKPVPLDLLEAELRQAIADRPELEKGLDAAESAGIVGASPAISGVVDELLAALAAPALPPAGLNLNAVLEEIEDRLIREALERTQGNRTQAADALGINRTTLVEKLRRMSRR